MNQQSAAVLESLLRGNDLGWIIDLYGPNDRLIPSLLEQLDRVTAEYRSRIREDVSFTPEALTAEAERNPHKVQAFLEALRATQSPEMLVMVWRILQGLSIWKVEMKYQELEAFSLLVVLARPGAEPHDREEYRSQDIMDFRLLWDFGVGTVGDKPLFAGFYPPPEKGRTSVSLSPS
jgi:hypothetical protein